MNINMTFTGELKEAYGIPSHEKYYTPNYFFRIKGDILLIYDGNCLETWGHIYEIKTLDHNLIRIDFIRKEERMEDFKFVIVKNLRATEHIN